MKKYLILFVLAFIQGCSSGGGDNTDEPATTNPSGFPDVTGHYSFNTTAINGTCTDGSVVSNPAIAFNVDVFQNANEITLVNTSIDGGIPGITIIDSNNATGNVQTNSAFIVTQIITANITDITGTVTLSYNWSGTFTNTGWSGKYTYVMSIPSLGGSCTFTTTFSGTKISATVSAAKLAKAPYDFENFQIDLYDSFGAIASLAARQ